MHPAIFRSTIVVPGCKQLPDMDSETARFWLTCIAGQESAWVFRVQKPVGYAHGFWQFERRGATIEVLTNARVKERAAALCKAAGVWPPGLDQVFDAIIDADLLACGLARLVLWLDDAPLPNVPDIDAGWAYYVRNWRPGKPDRHRWDDVYEQVRGLGSSASPIRA